MIGGELEFNGMGKDDSSTSREGGKYCQSRGKSVLNKNHSGGLSGGVEVLRKDIRKKGKGEVKLVSLVWLKGGRCAGGGAVAAINRASAGLVRHPVKGPHSGQKGGERQGPKTESETKQEFNQLIRPDREY